MSPPFVLVGGGVSLVPRSTPPPSAGGGGATVLAVAATVAACPTVRLPHQLSCLVRRSARVGAESGGGRRCRALRAPRLGAAFAVRRSSLPPNNAGGVPLRGRVFGRSATGGGWWPWLAWRLHPPPTVAALPHSLHPRSRPLSWAVVGALASPTVRGRPINTKCVVI